MPLKTENDKFTFRALSAATPGVTSMLATLFLGAACLLAMADSSVPYDRLLPLVSVWSQEIDIRTIDLTRPAEYRETLGVFPVGNGRCFTYAGLGIPQNTLFMITGPRYQTDGDHNPMGAFGEVAMTLTDAGTPVEFPFQGCSTVRGAPVVLTCDRSERMRLTTVTAAPPGTSAILRWFTIERLDGATGDVSVVFTLRGPALQKDDEGVFVESRHGKWNERMRPFVIGRKLEERDGKLGFTVPQVAKGVPQTFVLALLCSDSPADHAALKEKVLRDHERMLGDTVAWWNSKLAPTLHVSSGDRRLDDLIEGLKVLLLVQQDVQGGVCPMVNFKGVWLRDSNGPILGFLATGLFDETRRLLTYYRQASALHKSTARQFPLDLDVAADPDLKPEEWATTGTDRCEVPSFVVIQHAWWFDATGDKSLVERHWPYVRRNAVHQKLHEGPHGPLQTFNGDETYLWGAFYSLFPSRAPFPNALVRADGFSADSMFEYVVAHESMVRLARLLGHEGDAAIFSESAARMRQSIERHFWLPEESRYAPVLSPVDFTPHRAPFAPVNFHPLWLGYLSSNDPKAASNIEGALTWLWRSPGLVRMTPFLDYYIGSLPGELLYSLAALRHPKAEPAFTALLGSASRSGEWVEVHKPDRPSFGYGDGLYANRLRPWESGINLDAVLFYLTGARRNEGRAIEVNPLLPPGCNHLVVENMPLGRGRLRLTMDRVDGRARYEVVNTSEVALTVNGMGLAPAAVLKGEAKLPPPAPLNDPAPGTYFELLTWKENVEALVVTAQREAPAKGVQLLDAGLPFQGEDFAAFLAKRPRTLKTITIHKSAQAYDSATLKPLPQVLDHPRVRRELEGFAKDGGSVVVAN